MLDEVELDLIEELKEPEFAKSYGSECAKSEIGLTLFHARQKANLTQKELAEKLEVKQPYIAQIESGEANLTFEAAGRMLAVLGLKMKIITESLEPHENLLELAPESKRLKTPAQFSRI
jgi:transcriptional regulator with XRE-family HTH domain